MPRRLISAVNSEIKNFSAIDLKESIRGSEGRTILSQNFVAFDPLVQDTINPEMANALGADMVFLNGYSMDFDSNLPGLQITTPNGEVKNLRAKDVKEMVHMPVGVYLECGDTKNVDPSAASGNPSQIMVRKDRVASKENLEKVLKEKIDFIVLGGNPGSGTTLKTIIEATKDAKEILGDKVMIWSGKWEDGVHEKVLGDPLRKDNKEKIADLIDAGADVICLPMPGYRQGIDMESIRNLVTFVYSYGKKDTLVMNFLDGSVESSDIDTIRQCALMSKQTGADIHAIGDAGPHGIATPEDIYQLCLTIKGRRLTWMKMAAGHR